MAYDRLRRQIAQLIRRYPIIIRVPYTFWRMIQPRYTMGVVGVVVNEDNQVLLVEHVFHRIPWGLPGGWVGRNEDPSDAVKRELREELDLDIEIRAILITNVEKPNHFNMAFLCRAKNSVGNISDELLGHRWYTVPELPEKMYTFHRQAIQKAQQYLQENAL